MSALTDHVFDRFHVMPLAGRAVDEVRKDLRGAGADVKSGLWALRGNENNLRELVRNLGVAGKEISSVAPQDLLFMADAQPLGHLQKTGSMHPQPLSGNASYYPNHITAAAIESINGIIQTVDVVHAASTTSKTSRPSASG